MDISTGKGMAGTASEVSAREPAPVTPSSSQRIHIWVTQATTGGATAVSVVKRDAAFKNDCVALMNGRMLAAQITSERADMSKAMNQKKDQKKKPAKTFTEKRDVRRAKKAARASARPI